MITEFSLYCHGGGINRIQGPRLQVTSNQHNALFWDFKET